MSHRRPRHRNHDRHAISIVLDNEKKQFQAMEKKLKRKFGFEHSRYFPDVSVLPLPEDQKDDLLCNGPMALSVLACDTFTAAQDFAPDVLVLNMASDWQPGGGYKRGAMAQEESLFYRSTLPRMISGEHYPLSPMAAIYSPQVHVFREAHTWDLLHPQDCFNVNVLTMAAHRHTKKRPATREIITEKVRGLLNLAKHLGHSSLILGAWGCGAYDNNPEYVARAFAKLLPKFPCFQNVTFAILGAENLKIFEEVLVKKPIPVYCGPTLSPPSPRSQVMIDAILAKAEAFETRLQNKSPEEQAQYWQRCNAYLDSTEDFGPIHIRDGAASEDGDGDEEDNDFGL